MDKQYQPTLTEVQDWVLKLYNTCEPCIATVLLCLVLPSVLCKLQFEILFSHFLHLHNSDSYGQTISTDPYRSTGLGT